MVGAATTMNVLEEGARAPEKAGGDPEAGGAPPAQEEAAAGGTETPTPTPTGTEERGVKRKLKAVEEAVDHEAKFKDCYPLKLGAKEFVSGRDLKLFICQMFNRSPVGLPLNEVGLLE